MSLPPADNAVTVVLRAAARGDRQAAADLLPLVYDELRRLAAARLRQTPPGNTLQATALVHEAYLRLVGTGEPANRDWDGRHHFFGAAARAMRLILVEQARRKAGPKHGGGRQRSALSGVALPDAAEPVDVLDLDSAISRLESQNPRRAEIVILRCFAGLSEAETAAALGVTDRTIRREWMFVKAWLMREIEGARGAAGG